MMQENKENHRLGELSPELRLMLASASSEVAKNRGIIKNLLSQPIDWELVVKMAVHHRVYPLVSKNLNSLGKTVIPEKSRGVLQQKCRSSTMQVLGIAGATVSLVSSLEKKKIPSIVLKGPAVGQRLYGEIAVRPSKDIDLLVWPDDLEQAGQILEEQGYRRIHPSFPLTPARQKAYIQGTHHFNYWHDTLKIEVELHWKLGHTGWELPLPEVSSLGRIEVAGCSLPVLDDETWLLFLVMHGTDHGWFRLRWLCDIGEFMIQEDMDWERVMQMADAFDMRTVLHQGLILAHQLLNVGVPERFHLALEKDKKAWKLAKLTVQFLQNAHDEPWDDRRGREWRLFWRQKKYDWQIRTSGRKKCNYMLNMFKPSEEDIEHISLPDSLYWVYYIIRPFSWLWRRMR